MGQFEHGRSMPATRGARAPDSRCILLQCMSQKLAKAALPEGLLSRRCWGQSIRERKPGAFILGDPGLASLAFLRLKAAL